LERKQILDRLGDEHLPYISMAYRAAEHETTGNTPNYMMLGREVTTQLDIQYCMPRSIAHIPQNRWAWILKDRMPCTGIRNLNLLTFFSWKILWIFLSYPIHMYYLWFTFSTSVNFVSDICDFFYHFEGSSPQATDNVGIDSEVQKSSRQKRKPVWLADYETY
jgi:hypothetical protein